MQLATTRATADALFLTELALVEDGVRRQNSDYEGISNEGAAAFRKLTKQLSSAWWLLSKAPTPVCTRIKCVMICRLRRFRNTHLTAEASVLVAA